jgi:Ribbon-helix-helix protein, copG family
MIRCMQRTNVYLGEGQSSALDKVAHAQGISRGELIRQYIDAGLGAAGGTDLASDLAAIDESFGVLRDQEVILTRGFDERAKYLKRLAGRDSRR